MYFYSAKESGFYSTSLHGDSIPVDAKQISIERYYQLLSQQANGMLITSDAAGDPVAVPRPSTDSIQTSCTPAQGLVALFAIKRITEDDVLAEIARISDEVQRYTARIGYQRATSWERNSPTMQTMAQLLQLSETDLDALFSYAAGVAV